MSKFSVNIKKILAIEPHPNADALEIAVIDGYNSIIQKGQYKKNDLVAYIPEASIIPEWLLKRMGFWDNENNSGKLSGTKGNRVKCVRLRGIFSQGICYSVTPTKFIDQFDETKLEDGYYLEVDKEDFGFCGFVAKEGNNVASILGIKKYEPLIPAQMSGEVFNAGSNLTVSFDVENWKSYPNILEDGEEVVFSEKIHGTCSGVSVLPLCDSHPEAFGENKNILIYSKGLGSQGLVFKNNDKNINNIYVRATAELIKSIDKFVDFKSLTEPLIFVGETFGPCVQDLHYGKELQFRLFAALHGYRGKQRYEDFDILNFYAKQFNVEIVPLLYRGPFSVAIMKEYTDGKTTLGGEHIREGIVMVPVKERYDNTIGRVALKSISGEYLARKGGTEYN